METIVIDLADNNVTLADGVHTNSRQAVLVNDQCAIEIEHMSGLEWLTLWVWDKTGHHPSFRSDNSASPPTPITFSGHIEPDDIEAFGVKLIQLAELARRKAKEVS